MVLNPFSSSTETDSDATPIEQKQSEKDGSSSSTSSDNWKGFLLACLTNILYTLIIGIIGANFIFYTSLNDIQQEAFFPSHLQDYFPDSLIPGADTLTASEKKMTEQVRQASSGTSAGDLLADAIIETGKVALGASTSNQLRTGGRQRGGSWKCKAHQQTSISMPKGSGAILNKIGIPPSGGWPYSMRKGNNDGLGIQGIKDWWALSSADTYCQSRHFIKMILGWGAGLNEALGGSDGFLMFMGVVIMLVVTALTTFPAPFLSVIPIVIFLLALFHCFARAIESADHWYSKIGIFLLSIWPSIIVSMGISFMQVIQYFLTFLVLPLIASPNLIREMLACNQETLALLFGGLCVGSAGTFLDGTMASTMLVVWIILLIRSFF